jgi:hypothetical protein
MPSSGTESLSARQVRCARLRRPEISVEIERQVRAELAKGTGIITAAKRLGLGNGTVHRIRREKAAL